MNNRHRSLVLVVISVFAVAVAMRTAHLFWSPLPATGDAFGYAAQARDTIDLGHFPLAQFRADNFVFAGLLVGVGLVVGDSPLYLAQPIIAIVGASSCLAVVAIVYRAGAELSWPNRDVRYAAVFSGFTLAIGGLYLRRSGVPDEEALAFVFIPLVALALERYWQSERFAWLLVAGVFLIAFPLTHTFSTLIAGLTIMALLAIHLHRSLTRNKVLSGIAIVGGFWVYFALYYEFAERTVLTVPYVSRVQSHPGLFAAWVIILLLGVVWFTQTRTRVKQAAFLLPFVGWFAILLVNIVTPIFPGTITSPGILTVLVLLYAVPVSVASSQVNLLSEAPSSGAILLALIAAPIIHVHFALTAALSPEYFATVMRTQTFAHFTVFALAGLAVGGLVSKRDLASASLPATHSILLGILVLSVVLTVPIAFIELDTVEYPVTTHPDEFAGVEFASTYASNAWATDHALSRMGVHYFAQDVAITPVATWLYGGPPPACAVLSARSWTTSGAHFFPGSPETISTKRYEDALETRNVIYVSSGPKEIVVSTPSTDVGPTC